MRTLKSVFTSLPLLLVISLSHNSTLLAFENDEVLIDFENQNDIKVVEVGSAKANLLTNATTFGDKQSLKIDFSQQSRFSGVRLIPETPWDWSGHEEFNLAFDVRNQSEHSIQLYLSLIDERGQAFDNTVLGHRAVTANRSVVIPARAERTVYTILAGQFIETDAGIREKPAPWPNKANESMMVWRYGTSDINLAKLSEIGLFVRGTLDMKSVQIDNVRLRPNPSYADDYLLNIVDEFGQNAKRDYPNKVASTKELKQAATKELEALEKSKPMPDRSRFGGWKNGPKLKATGYFRTQKIDDQWWMVDPDGFLFFSHGVANVRMANLTTTTGIDFKDDSVRQVDPNEITPEDSIGIVAVSDKTRASRYIRSQNRHNMFSWLPAYDDELAEHYSYRRKVHRGPVDSGETFSFYRANLERRYGQTEPESYVRKWEEVTLKRFLDWGFTSMGNWVDPAFYPNTQVPYFANGWIIGDFKTLVSEHDVWAPMPDPYDPDFVARAKITIDAIAKEIQGSPWCVGIFVDNEKSWGYRQGTVQQRYGVILNALSKDQTASPAKAAFVQYLKNKYHSIKLLNTAWQSDFKSWEALGKAVDQEYQGTEYVVDLSNMLEQLSEQYFKVVHNAVARALPNHLYMGARMANFGMPDETIKASVKYSDVLSFNIYEEGVQPHDWAFLKDIDLPSVIGEFHIGAFEGAGVFHPGLVQAHDQADRAQMYYDYMQSVAAHKNMVGAHWFQYIDSPITGRAFDGEPYNVGFVSNTDIPYPEMVAAAKRFNRKLYPSRFAQRDSNSDKQN